MKPMWKKIVGVGTLCMALGVGSISADAKEKSFILSAAGDCTFASDIKQPASVNFFSVYKKKSPEYFLKKVQPVFAKDDLTLVNFEGTLSKRGSRENKTWAFRGRPAFVNILKKGSVEAVSLSNNHTRDYGLVSFQDTKDILKEAEVAFSTDTKTTIKTVNGVRVGLVSINSIQGSFSAVTYLKNAMKQVKKKKPEVIIVSMHSGVEYTQVIQPIQKQLSHTAIDMGADVVLGHHPHIMQGIDRYKGKYIVYSLGNFCFGGNTNPPDKDAIIFQQKFVIKNGKVSKKESCAKVIPVRISGKDNINNYQPIISKGNRKSKCIARLKQYSKPFGVRVTKKGNLR